MWEKIFLQIFDEKIFFLKNFPTPNFDGLLLPNLENGQNRCFYEFLNFSHKVHSNQILFWSISN